MSLNIKKILYDAGGIVLAPSILSADFAKLGDELAAAGNAGADMIHLDIMDGHFVPNISFGPPVVGSIIGETHLPMDAHLMISDPVRYGKKFAESGVDIITAHIEILKSIADWRMFRREMKAQVGISINPPTKLADTAAIVDNFEMILIMSVNPGFSGQKFIPDVLGKIEAIANEVERNKLARFIAVDGGINFETAKLARDAGANFLVAGNAFFKANDYSTAVKRIKGL